MPDKRSHRGAHPEDHDLFAPDQWPNLRAASADLCWLLQRGYAVTSSLKLVGDRYALAKRQRIAVGRAACSAQSRSARQSRRLDPRQLAGQELWIDGYNVLTSIEAALGQGVLLAACDGCYRDMASMHGSYRKVDETLPALRLIGETLERWQVARSVWLLDRPVSNSGHLRQLMLTLSRDARWQWDVHLEMNPDRVLREAGYPVASSDSVILDHCRHWVNLVRPIVLQDIAEAYVVDLDVFGNEADQWQH